VGSSMYANVQVGPVVNERQATNVERTIRDPPRDMSLIEFCVRLLVALLQDKLYALVVSIIE
jgi:hypothetical protein